MTDPFDLILDTVGRTPVVRLDRLAPDSIDLFVMLEAFNPHDSVKARLVFGLVDAAERSARIPGCGAGGGTVAQYGAALSARGRVGGGAQACTEAA